MTDEYRGRLRQQDADVRWLHYWRLGGGMMSENTGDVSARQTAYRILMARGWNDEQLQVYMADPPRFPKEIKSKRKRYTTLGGDELLSLRWLVPQWELPQPATEDEGREWATKIRKGIEAIGHLPSKRDKGVA
jgi:hypothetical protein